MKTLLTLVVFFFTAELCMAQELFSSQINSLNVLEYYQRIQEPQPSGNQSQNIAVQIGNGNIMEVIDQMPNYIELTQMGNYNTIYFVNPNEYPTNAEINVQGSGNYIDIVGSNSISDGMKININANDMTIYMRNY